MIERQEKLRAIWAPLPGPQQAAIDSPADELFFGGAAGGGKMLPLTMPLPTPGGWTTIGDLFPGAAIFDERGQPCTVVALHPIDDAPASYRITFDDGVQMVACADHLWTTFTAPELAALTRISPEWHAARRQKRPRRVGGKKSEKFTASLAARNAARVYDHAGPPSGGVRSTAEIMATLTTKSGRANHAIQVAEALQLPDAPVPIDPYVLGAWLGDGNSRGASITCHDKEILDQIAAAGFAISPRAEVGAFGINGGLIAALRGVGLLANKHIPAVYLRTSVAQRVALLQGLMDTDGNCTTSGACEFTTTSIALRDGMQELLSSLGVKCCFSTGRATLDGRDCGPKYRFKFMTNYPAFRLSRKLQRQHRRARRTTRFRYIKSVEPVASVPMRCITVDSPSHLYLAGPYMVPTHNTDLILGAAVTKHHNSLIFRREFAQLKGMRDRSDQLYTGAGRYNSQDHVWRLSDGQWIEFGGVQLATDVNKYQGRPSDLKAFDEITHFTRSQYEFLKGWRRTSKQGQRTRVICTGNPPTDAEGDWVIEYWAPWLDPLHPNPAKDGELRWFATVKGKDTEVAGPTPFYVEGEPDLVEPTSRTFIRSRVQDNPYYMRSGYLAVLQALPEPLRSQMLFGSFGAGKEDNAWQVIPSEWVIAAQGRWTEDGHNGRPMDALGVDVARGGKDHTVLAPRHANWFGPLVRHPGSDTPDGQTVVGFILRALAESPSPAIPGHRTSINMDTIGVGASPQDLGREHGLNIVPCVGSHGSEARDRSGQFGFINARSEWLWTLREALDPVLGENYALPPDRRILADLTAARWKVTARGIQVESKEEIKKRIMRSPDDGDAIMYAHAETQSTATAWMAYLRDQVAEREAQRRG